MGKNLPASNKTYLEENSRKKSFFCATSSPSPLITLLTLATVPMTLGTIRYQESKFLSSLNFFFFFLAPFWVPPANACTKLAGSRSSTMAAKKLIYPAADRNKDPILSVLKRFIRPGPNQALLEIASGSGQHTAHFAPHFPQVTFFPSECENRLLESISAHTSGLSNVRPPSLIDISSDFYQWPNIKFQENSLDYIYCANMIHISPYRCTIGLFRNSGILLKNNGYLITYGAYSIDGKLSPESNIRFDESLKSQNPEWGIRDLRELQLLAKSNNIYLIEIVDMPANNKTIIWQKTYQ